jgi:hypothetical protein
LLGFEPPNRGVQRGIEFNCGRLHIPAWYNLFEPCQTGFSAGDYQCCSCDGKRQVAQSLASCRQKSS